MKDKKFQGYTKNNKQGKNKSKGKKFNNQADVRMQRMLDRDFNSYSRSDTDGSNDVKWYTRNEQLVLDVGRFSFNNPLGAAIEVGNALTATSDLYTADLATSYRVPGVASINLFPTIGISTDSTSAANVAATNTYSYVRHANSGSKNYEKVDLMIYLISVAQLYSFYSWMTRIYGVINFYNQRNRYVPKVIIESMSVDFDDILSHLADFRAFINMAATQLSALYIPNTMSIYDRSMWIYSNLYQDSSNDKAQIYLFNPDCFHYFTPVAEETGGSLTTMPMREVGAGGELVLLKFEDIITKFTTMLNAVLDDEDMGIISGDIKKAYGDNLLYVKEIPEGYIVRPEYNEEVLAQIHNLRICGHYQYADYPRAIYQENGILKTRFQFEDAWVSTDGGGAYSLVLNSRHDTPEPGEVIVSSRLSAISTPGTYLPEPGTWFHGIYTCGTEILTTVQVFFNQRNANTALQRTDIDSSTLKVSGAASARLSRIAQYLLNYQFDWFPIIMGITQNSASNIIAPYGIFSDLDNYTILQPSDVAKINDVCLLSMFGVPQEYTVQRK